MDDFVFAFTGVILQMLGLNVAIAGLVFKAIELGKSLVSNDTPRSSQEDEPRQ